MSFRIILPYPIKSNSQTKQNWFGSKKSFNLQISQPSFFGRESSVETNELQIALGVVSRRSMDSVKSHLGFPLLMMSKIDLFIYF